MSVCILSLFYVQFLLLLLSCIYLNLTYISGFLFFLPFYYNLTYWALSVVATRLVRKEEIFRRKLFLFSLLSRTRLFRGFTVCTLQSNQGTVCPWSSYPFYIVSFYIKWVRNCWTYSNTVNRHTIVLVVQSVKIINSLQSNNCLKELKWMAKLLSSLARSIYCFIFGLHKTILKNKKKTKYGC